MDRRARVSIGAAAALLAAGCAAAAAPGKAAEAPVDEGPVICRETLVSGSNVMDDLCLTGKGWKEFERRRRTNSQEAVRRMQGFPGAGF